MRFNRVNFGYGRTHHQDKFSRNRRMPGALHGLVDVAGFDVEFDSALLAFWQSLKNLSADKGCRIY